MAVAGEAACRAAALSPPDRASLGRLGIRDDLRVEFWFNPSAFSAAGAWEQGTVTRLNGSGARRAFYVAFPEPGVPEPEWNEYGQPMTLSKLAKDKKNWRPGWSQPIPIGMGGKPVQKRKKSGGASAAKKRRQHAEGATPRPSAMPPPPAAAAPTPRNELQ